MTIYVASSWRNEHYEKTVNFLRDQGFYVYDFKNPKTHFTWKEISRTPLNEWTFKHLQLALNHPLSQQGFSADYTALEECDACVLLTPCGRSAHLELGYAIGRMKHSAIYIKEQTFEPELMYKMADFVSDDLEKIVRFLHVQQ